jgi:carboxymethylenebutenolidase
MCIFQFALSKDIPFNPIQNQVIMDQKIINLFDEYTHTPLSREQFIGKLAKITGSATAALAMLPLLEVQYAHAATVSAIDTDLILEDITYPSSANLAMKAYLAKPKNEQPKGSIVVIHENRGLNPHTKDVARRFAKEGYIALAPDALSQFGGTPENDDQARELIGKLEKAENLQHYLDGLKYLRTNPDSNKKTACIGFCWGGGMAGQIALNDPQLNASISFYGKQPDENDDLTKIKARMQMHYGELDERINAGIKSYEAALEKADIPYELYIYKGVQHAFFNDNAPARYNEKAANMAWTRTLALLEQTIR